MAEQNLVVEIPFGMQGLWGSKNLSRIPVDALVQAENVTYFGGTIQKEGGASKYNSTAISGNPAILGGFDWDHDDATQRQVVVGDDGAIYKDDGSGSFSTTLKTGLNMTNALPIFAEGGKEAAANDRKLFIFTRNNAVQVLAANGSSTSDITSAATDWSGSNHPRFGFVHDGRLFAGGNDNDPHRLYYSDNTDHEDFQTGNSGTIAIYPGESIRITRAFPWRNGVVIFKKPRGVYFLDTTDPTITNWRVFKVSDAHGLLGVNNVIQVGDQIFFIDTGGELYVVTPSDSEGGSGMRLDNLSRRNDIGNFMRDNFNFDNVGEWTMHYYSRKRELHIGLTGLGASTNNARFVISFHDQIPIKFRYSPRDDAVSLWSRIGSGNIEELMLGDDNGFVWQLDQEAKNKDSVGYASTWKTPEIDLSHLDPEFATRQKYGRFVEVIAEPKGNWDISLDIIWDGKVTDTVQVNLGEDTAALGSFVLGTNKLGAINLINKRVRITGGGRRLALQGTNSGADQDFSIARIFLHLGLADQRLPLT